MAVNILPTSEVRDRISSVLDRLKETGEVVFVTRYSKAEAVLLPVDRYNAMMDILEDREDELDSELGMRIREARSAHSRGEGRGFEAFIAKLER